MENKKRILIINGHPDDQSFCMAVADAYEKGAREALVRNASASLADVGGGAEVKRINLRDLKFDPILHCGYRVIQPLEPDLIMAQEAIKWAEHLVFVTPTWWLGLPALMKGFIDRTFLPGFGFHYHKDSPMWDKLLKGRSARCFITMDAPKLYNWLMYFSNGQVSLIKGTLGFCGIKPVKCDIFDQMRFSTPEKRAKWLKLAEERGRKLQ